MLKVRLGISLLLSLKMSGLISRSLIFVLTFYIWHDNLFFSCGATFSFLMAAYLGPDLYKVSGYTSKEITLIIN